MSAGERAEGVLAAQSEIGLKARGALLAAAMTLLFLTVAGQLVHLSLATRGGDMRIAMAEPIGRMFSRPDIVDRHGALIATDVAAPSLYADPALIVDLDEAIEKLVRLFPDLDQAELRKSLGDRARRFAWVKRSLTPLQAQHAHDLGLPGFAFRREPKRVYPSGALVGHLVGQVNIDNKGLAGLERYMDETLGVDAVQTPEPSDSKPMRLSIDLGVQHAVADELRDAVSRYKANGAAGVVMDVRSGEVIAAVSLPEIDPNRPAEALETDHLDRVSGGIYELGSIFKTFTIAMALEERIASLDKIYDVREPLHAGGFTITDLHPQPRPLSVRDIFLHSSNIGAGLIALEAGSDRQIGFLSRLGLLSPLRTEEGLVAPPMLPKHWGEVETITIAFGHGFAIAPIQFAAAVATLVNGGFRVTPTFLAAPDRAPQEASRIVSAETSARICEILRLNVTASYGTGKRAEVAGYRVGGKTGTAEIPKKGGYASKAVIASFVAVLPADAPRYLTLVSLFEPHATEETKGHITAGVNAAPVTGRLIARAAPLLGVLPRGVESSETVADRGGTFDAPAQGKY